MVQTQQIQETDKCRISEELRHEPSKNSPVLLFFSDLLRFQQVITYYVNENMQYIFLRFQSVF